MERCITALKRQSARGKSGEAVVTLDLQSFGRLSRLDALHFLRIWLKRSKRGAQRAERTGIQPTGYRRKRTALAQAGQRAIPQVGMDLPGHPQIAARILTSLQRQLRCALPPLGRQAQKVAPQGKNIGKTWPVHAPIRQRANKPGP